MGRPRQESVAPSRGGRRSKPAARACRPRCRRSSGPSHPSFRQPARKSCPAAPADRGDALSDMSEVTVATAWAVRESTTTPSSRGAASSGDRYSGADGASAPLLLPGRGQTGRRPVGFGSPKPATRGSNGCGGEDGRHPRPDAADAGGRRAAGRSGADSRAGRPAETAVMCSNGRGDRGETGGARSFSREAGSVARMGPTTAVAGDRGGRGLEGATRVQRPDGAGERPPPMDPS